MIKLMSNKLYSINLVVSHKKSKKKSNFLYENQTLINYKLKFKIVQLTKIITSYICMYVCKYINNFIFVLLYIYYYCN